MTAYFIPELQPGKDASDHVAVGISGDLGHVQRGVAAARAQNHPRVRRERPRAPGYFFSGAGIPDATRLTCSFDC